MPPARRAAKTPPQQLGRAAKKGAPAQPTPADALSTATAAQKPATTKTRKIGSAKARRPAATNARGAATRGRGAETTVVVVGAGRLGSALALALEDAGGYRVVALVSRRRARARRAARALRPGTLALSAAELDRIPPSDLLILATPDDQIGPTAARLAAAFAFNETDATDETRAPGQAHATNETQALSRTHALSATHALNETRAPNETHARPRGGGARGGAARPVALHASGALSSEALAPLRARGLSVGSLHPLVSVSDPASAARGWRGAFFCVEGDAAAVRAARRIVRALGGRAFSVRPADKALYHAAAVLASGHAVALFDLAAETLAACGLSPREARRVLLPLARSTLANLAAAPRAARALTGPFARADVETVRRHLSAFGARRLRGVRRVYAELGLRSLRLAAESGADSAALAEIERALSAAMKAAR